MTSVIFQMFAHDERMGEGSTFLRVTIEHYVQYRSRVQNETFRSLFVFLRQITALTFPTQRTAHIAFLRC